MALCMKQNWYEKTIDEVLAALGTTTNGLSEQEAALRLKRDGANVLPEAKQPSLIQIFFSQFKSPLVYILLIVSVIVLLLGDVADSIVISIVLLFNAIVGALQEGKANNTLAALRNFIQTQALVIRDGKEIMISDKELVVGDIVVLHEGNRIPADGRLIEVVGATVDEASLTGESNAIVKTIEPIKDDSSLSTLSPADQLNMVFKGTNIVSGSASFVVTATGVNTQIGQLSAKVMGLDTEIPLQKNIRYLSRIIVVAVSILSVGLILLGLWLGFEPLLMIKTSVALAVSIIPSGLPIVMTLILANGVWRMGQRKALVKKLAAVEALGHANVIAVDKTGTITRNQLVVKKIFVAGKTFDISGQGYEPKGEASYHGKIVVPNQTAELLLAAKFAAFASAELIYDSKTKAWLVQGDPTEAAMLVLAEKLGFAKKAVLANHRLIQEIPFNYRTKYRAVVFEDNGKHTLAVIGAPEAVASLAGHDHNEFEHAMSEMADDGLRIIAFGFVTVQGAVDPEQIPKIHFGGLYGMQDTLHHEVPSAVADVKSAGMKIVMITGDWPKTAKAIARQAGIFEKDDQVLTGVDLEKLSQNELLAVLPSTSVFARVTPDNKLRIVRGYQELGKIIAMTGDGVNDVPALVAADLGIAMGKTGTEVTKESADIILLDDNFSTIAAAVEEGRNIYKTIKRVMLYLASTSLGELFTIVGALLLAWPLPVTAVQILWLNLVTDGFLTIAFAAEPKEGNLLREPYRKPAKYLIDRFMVLRMIPLALIMAIGTLWLFNFYRDGDIVKAQTIALTVLAIYQWYNAFNCRSETRSAFSQAFTNKWLWAAIAAIVVLQFMAVHWGPMQKILGTVSLTINEWLVTLAVASSILIWEELVKMLRRLVLSWQRD